MSGFCQYLPSNRKKKFSPKKKVVEKQPNFQSFINIQPKNRNAYSRKKTIQSQYISKRKQTKTKIDAKNYNIFHIDSKIREQLLSNITSLPELESDLKKTLWIVSNGPDAAQRISAKQHASILRKRIRDLESTFELSFYILSTSDLLDRYRLLIKEAGAKSFVSVKPSEKDREISTEMEKIIDYYLSIAKNYVDVENFSRKSKRMICPACNSYNFRQSIDDESIYICKTCFTEIEVLGDSPSFKDTDRVNMSSKYTYTRKGHFIDAVKRFQGIQNTDPQKIQNAVQTVETEMKKHNLISVQSQSHSVSKDHVYMFLSEQNLSGHYDDLNLIFHIITGEDCPDITEYADQLYEDFDYQEKALEKVKDSNRQNSLNVNYKLYKLLQRQGYSCRKDDFYILKTKAKEDEHDEKLKEAWIKVLGWRWIPTV